MTKAAAFVGIVILFLWGGITYNGYLDKKAAEEAARAEEQVKLGSQKAMEGFNIEDITVGTGAEAKAGNAVTVHYKGTLSDGKQFDSSYDRKQPFEFTLGSGDVIEGWELGIQGMKVGGTRKLTIPPALAYGEQGRPPVIPENATLYFDVELLVVK